MADTFRHAADQGPTAFPVLLNTGPRRLRGRWPEPVDLLLREYRSAPGWLSEIVVAFGPCDLWGRLHIDLCRADSAVCPVL